VPRHRGARRAARWVASGLHVWPAAARARDGAALLATVEEELDDAARRGRGTLLRCALAEWAAVVRTGLALRLRDARRRAAGPGLGLGATGWAQDARVAGRRLRHAPGFTIVAAGTLALGIGANAAVFDGVDRILLRPPPYAHPDELVLLWATGAGSARHLPVAAPDAAEIDERVGALRALAFTGRGTDAALARAQSETPAHARVARVSPAFFDVLGVRVALGRGFLEEDATDASAAAPDAGAPPGVLLSDGAWRRVFQADPGLVGRTALLDGRPVTVLGVVASGFRLELPPAAGIATDVDVWVPLRVPLSGFVRDAGRLVDLDADNAGAVVGRLAPGATLDRLREELDRVAAALRTEVPGYAAAGLGLEAEPLHADATAHARPLLLSLFTGALGVLLVSCLSLGALLVARASAGARERALRVALGATRGRLLRAVLLERSLLLLLGGGTALLVGWAAARGLGRILPPSLARLADGPAPSLLPFVATATAAVAALLTLPALLGAGLRAAEVRPSARLLRGGFQRGRAREALVVAEIAVSVVLVLGAGLLLRTAGALRDVDPGFQPRGALVFHASVRVAGAYTGPADRARLARTLEDAVRELPGVRGVGLTGALPLSGRRWTQPWGLPGEAVSGWSVRRADFRMVTSGYFEAVGTRLLEGRTFTRDEDLTERARVVVVDASLARRIAPDGSALGATIGIPLDGSAVQARVVGVVEPVRSDDLASPAREAIYVPYRQEASRDISFVVRTEGDPAALAPAVRRVLLGVEPRLAVWGMQPMTAWVDTALAPTRFGLTLLSLYAALTLLAAALGLWGVIAWEVGRRTRELGVRMAVGASAGRVRASVLARGLRLAGLGVALGLAAGAVASRGLRALVYGVGVADPATWIGSVGLVAGIALLASWVPALRASRLDPGAALRAE